MKLLFALTLLIGATSGVAENIGLPKPWPTALERFLDHRHTQVIEVHEVAQYRSGEELIKMTGLVARNDHTHPSEMRGIWFAVVVSEGDKSDNVYLPVKRAVALRARLVEMSETANHWTPGNTPMAMLGTEDCRPSLPVPRMHKLCVGLYKRQDEIGLAVSTGNASLFLEDVKLSDFVDSIDLALASIERP